MSRKENLRSLELKKQGNEAGERSGAQVLRGAAERAGAV